VSKFDSVTKKACAGRGFLELVAARFREAQKTRSATAFGLALRGFWPHHD